MNSLAGKQTGNYRLIRLLDTGGFAQVYLAEHVTLQTRCAVKILHMDLFEEQQQQQFLTEARLHARLNHPQIIRVLDFGLENQQPFLVMTYAPRGNIRQLHPEGTRVPLELVVTYVQQTAAALQYAHEQRIIHRDVKPENLLLSDAGTLLLSDFGIALVARSSRSQSKEDIVGTTTYMAPEQIKGHPVPASDQYALAVLTYEWLCGKPPFEGQTEIEIARQHLLATPPALLERVPDLPSAVAMVVERGLAREHRQRFASVQEFAEALTLASTAGTLPAPPPALPPIEEERVSSEGSREGMRAPIARRTVLGWTVAGVALLGTGYLGWHWLTARPALHALQAIPTPVLPPPPTLPATPDTPIVAQRGQLFYTFTGQNGPLDVVVWSPNGQNIASASLSNEKPGGLINIWSALSGSVSITRDDYLLGNFSLNLRPDGDYNQGLTWSPKGNLIASNSLVNDAYYQISLWDPASGTTQSSLDASGVLAWSPDGQYLAVGFITGSTSAQVFRVASGTAVASYYGHRPISGETQDGNTYTVNSIAWSPNGQYLATSGMDNTVQVWHAFSGERICTYTEAAASAYHTGVVYNVAWSPDGRSVASAWYDGVVILDAMTGRLQQRLADQELQPLVLGWSPDGALLAIGGFSVLLWEPATNQQLFSYRGHSGAVTALAWSPDGQMIASGGYDETVQVWKAS